MFCCLVPSYVEAGVAGADCIRQRAHAMRPCVRCALLCKPVLEEQAEIDLSPVTSTQLAV